MSTKKLPSQATYEELLAALEEDDFDSTDETVTATEEDISKLTDDSVLIFLTHFNIKSGTNAVNKRLLYDLYKKHTLDPIDSHRFAIALGKYVTSYSNKKGSFYQINLDAFKITEEVLKLKNKNKISKDKSIGFRKRFEKFLNDCDIKTGQYWLQGFIIYEIYLEYLKKLDIKTVGFAFKPFIQMMKIYFTGTRRTSNRSLWFNVNEKTYNYFTQEQKDQIEKGRSQKKRKHKR